jgi:hypothetical protein
MVERVDAVGEDAALGQRADVMLRAGDEVDPRFRRRRQVALAIGIGGDERGSAIPVFR